VGPDSAPPFRWSGEGSASLGFVESAIRRSEETARPVLRALDATAGLLAGRWILLLATALIGNPLLRLTLGDDAALAPVLLLAAAAGTALLLRAASALHGEPERAWVVRALLVGLLLRVALAAAIAASGSFPDERLQYDPVSRLAAAEGPGGATDSLGRSRLVPGRWAYYALLTGTYGFLGSSPAAGRLLGILLGLGAALLAGEVARPLGGRRAAALAVLALALHPEAALWSGAITRDGLSAFLVLAALAAAARGTGGLLRGRALLLAGPLALLAMNSVPAAVALGAALAGAILLEGAAAAREGRGGVLRAGLALLLLVAALRAAEAVAGPWLDPARLASLRDGVLRADAGWFDEAARLPLGAAFALFAPWPWEAVNLLRLGYSLLALGGMAVTAFGIAGLAAAVRRSPLRAAAPALFALAFLAILALTEGNAGTVARHRLPLAAVLSVGAGILAAGYFSGGGERVRRTEPSFPE